MSGEDPPDQLPESNPPQEKPIEPQIIGTHHGETFDSPVTQVMEERVDDDGRKMLRVKFLQSDGRSNVLHEAESWVAADDVSFKEPAGHSTDEPLLDPVHWEGDISESPLPPPGPELITKKNEPDGSSVPQNIEVHVHQPAAEQASQIPEAVPEGYQSPSLAELRESILETQTKIPQLENLLNSGKAKAKEAIDADDFQKAASYANEAADRHSRLKKARDKLKYLENKLKLTEELLNPANVLDLKEKFDQELAKEKDRRDRLHDDQPLDSYAEMLKDHLIGKYLQTGVEEGKTRHVSNEVLAEIEQLLNKSYEELESYLPKHEADTSSAVAPEPQNPEPSPEPEPQPEPENNDQHQEIMEEEKHFQPGQPVQFIYEGRMHPGEVSGYRGRDTDGDPLVLILPPYPYNYRGDIPVPQSLLENWQRAPAEYNDITQIVKSTPENLPIDRGLKVFNTAENQAYEVQSVEDRPNGDKVAVLEPFGPGGNKSGPIDVPLSALEDMDRLRSPWRSSQEPVNNPELANSGGWWESLFRPVQTHAMELRGLPRDAVRRLGRLGRQAAQGDQDSSQP